MLEDCANMGTSQSVFMLLVTIFEVVIRERLSNLLCVRYRSFRPTQMQR